MNESPNQRVSVDLDRAITVATIVVALAAAFVVAREIILILFLGVLFGVFLTKLANRIGDQLPMGYSGSLALVVGTLLLVMAVGTMLFFVQVNHTVEQTSGKIDQGMMELRSLVDKYPALKSTIASTPFLSPFLGEESQELKRSVEPSQRDSNDSPSQGDRNDRPSQVERNDSDNTKDPANQSNLQSNGNAQAVTKVAGTIGQMFQTTFGVIVNSLLIFFVGLFLAISPENYRDGLVRLVPKPKRQRITEVLDAVADTLWRWLIGRFGSMLATGGGAFLLLLALGVPMAGTLGVLTALLTFVPNIGAAIALFLAVLFALPQGAGTVTAVVGGYLVLQLVESYVVTPLIEQKAVALPPALVISFQAIMGVLFGFIGAAVASPSLAAGKTIVQMLYVEDHLESDDPV